MCLYSVLVFDKSRVNDYCVSCKTNVFIKNGFLNTQISIFNKNIRLAAIPYFNRTLPKVAKPLL